MLKKFIEMYQKKEKIKNHLEDVMNNYTAKIGNIEKWVSDIL